MASEKTESIQKSEKPPELTLDMIDEGTAKIDFDTAIKMASRAIVKHVGQAGAKVSKCKSLAQMKVSIEYDKGQFSVKVMIETKTPPPVPRVDLLRMTETTGGTPTLSRGNFEGMDEDIHGQTYIDEK